MKKLFALILALGLLFSFAMAEDAALELSWDNVSEETKALGSFYPIDMQESGKLIYWVPQNMAAQDTSAIEAVGLVAAFATAGRRMLPDRASPKKMRSSSPPTASTRSVSSRKSRESTW